MATRFTKTAEKIGITDRILRRPITVIMLTLLVIFFGLFSLTRLKITLLPPFNIPILAISTSYKSVPPQDIQRLLVEPLEGAVSAVNGVEELDGNIRKGGAFIILRMQPEVDIRRAELDVREEIDRIRPDLPREASEPVIFQFDPENFPIMRLSLESGVRGLDELRQLATEFIEPRLERLRGVASADTRGGLERTIFVDIDPMALAQHQLEPAEITNAINSNNVQLPIGNVRADRTSYSVRAQSMYNNLEELRQTIIKVSENGIPIRIQDVAEVRDHFAEISTLVEVNGKNSVSIEVQKQSDANTLDVTKAVEGALVDIESQLPGGTEIRTLTNEGQYVESSINNLAQSALLALVVVIIILLLFMGGWRISLVVALSIPVSVTATFAAMYFLNITLNIISITGLALAIGLLVDNSIVVSESIATKLEEGFSRFESALRGTKEVIGALMGSTLTTLGVFVPILGLSGFAGQVARDLALTICIAISISFIAAVILIPVLASLLLNKDEFEKHSFTFRWMHKLEQYYARSLRWFMGRKWISVVFVLLIITGSYFLFKAVPGEFFPESDSGEINARIELPTGTKLTHTAQVIQQFSGRVQDIPEVESVITKIGQSGYRTETNAGELSIKLVPLEERDRSTNEVALQLRQLMQAPGVSVSISGLGGRGPSAAFGGGGIRLSLIGPEMDVLQALTDKIERRLLADSNVVSVENPRTDPTPELHYFVDRQRINRMGANLQTAANALKNQVLGTRAGFYRDEGREIPIQVRIGEDKITSREDLMDLQLLRIDDQRIPVAALGSFESVQGVNRIERRDRETVLDISVRYEGESREYRQKIINILKDDVVLPDGYRYEFTGASQQGQESQRELLFALLFAVALTYMIMASQFENFRDPFIVMFTIPLAFFGSLGLLWITGTPLSVPAGIGVVILIGIVVNNGIVMVDYLHQYTREGDMANYLPNLIIAARRRMRPILLTALTTICSMIPLALAVGSGSETWSPLARSVIGGLIFSTILSLYIVPMFVVGIAKQRRDAVKEQL
ncbi:MAG: efflux RND transporter permease subunit [Bacteroidota bacterium]